MNTIGKSIVKANNDIFDNGIARLNEDAIRISDKQVVICDGAGGIGILADQWAQILAKNVPEKPFKNVESIDKWIAGFWEKFYNTHIKTVQNDPWKLKKFEEEGSLATLSALWQLKKNEFIYQSYGDSALFIYNKEDGTLKIQDNLLSINSFTANPALINWQTEHLNPDNFYVQEIELHEHEEIIMATDGMSMYIYATYLAFSNNIGEKITETKMQEIVNYYKKNAISDFKQWISELKNTLNNEKVFTKLTTDWHKNKALPNDDYTLVFIRL